MPRIGFFVTTVLVLGSALAVAQEIQELEQAEDPWSATLEFGANGQTGNTERGAANAKLELRRTTDAERTKIYFKGRYSREDHDTTTKEVIGGLFLEQDLDEKWFLYERAEAEFDEAENVDLRLTAAGGVGYIVFDRPEETLKLRAGIGYEHENFGRSGGVDGNRDNTDDSVVADLGWDFRKELSPTLLFTHSVTLLPSFDRIKEFRAVMDNAVTIPLSKDEDWKLKLGVTNEYDGFPAKGSVRLDTYWYMNLAIDWQ